MEDEQEINARFQDTHWSVVNVVRWNPDSPEGARALAKLCKVYWYPLYSFARHTGLKWEDAQDATQSFFAKIVKENLFASALREKGLLRTFLLAAFKNHMASERRRANAGMRGGGVETVPLDFEEGESRYLKEPADRMSPERHFDRNWAWALARAALESLSRTEARARRGKQFAALRDLVLRLNDEGVDYAAAAAKVGMTVETVRRTVNRLRLKFRVCVKNHVAMTIPVPDKAQVDAEMAVLRASLAGR